MLKNEIEKDFILISEKIKKPSEHTREEKENFPDYKFQIVENFPDFTIKYVNAFPGVR